MAYASMSNRPTTQMKSEFDMDSFFDFNQSTTQPSPMTATSSTQNDAFSPFGKSEERQQYNGPSHDYNQYKQQVGLPVGSTANLPPMSQQQSFDGYNSGIGDMSFDGGLGGWSSGIDIDSDMAMDFNNPQSAMPAMFFPPPTSNDTGASDNFINPNSIGGQEETASSIRLWPGMHSQRAQQAAMQKAQQTQAVQQRQIKMQAQQAQYQRHASNASQTQMPQPQAQQQPQQSAANGKRASQGADPHVEESISRLLNQMRQQSNASADDDSADGMLPHIARMKRDEEDMDEDERLLNSDEGKKLSSKERRQLRNKVSARAFRSRRKEYISQLEGDLAIKAQESNQIRQENAQLLQENERYRGLIETLLRHPAFTPFIQDISKDPAVLGMPQHQTQHLQAPQPQQQLAPTPAQHPTQPHQQQSQQDVKPEYLNFDASQLQIPTQQDQSQQQVSLAMIPEENFSKLNLGNQFRGGLDFNNYSVNAYALTNLPLGPDPSHLLAPTPARLPNAYTTTANSNSDMDVLLARLDGAARRMTPI